MFNLAGSTKLRGIGYRLLNVLRPCNIVALLSVTVASWVMIVMTGVTGQFFFFDAIAHVFISSISMFLILTEVQLRPLKRYFERSWPVFAERHGFFWLGAAMVVLGCDMLANLNKPAFTVKNLGLPLWRVILAAGILSITFGIFNFIVTLVFRDGPANLTARMIRADGNLADGGKLGAGISNVGNNTDYYASSSVSSRHAPRYNKEEQLGFDDAESALGGSGGDAATAGRFKRMTQAFKKSPFAGGKKIEISKPIPVGNYDDENAGHADPGDYYAHTNDAATTVADNDSARDRSIYPEDRASPILPTVQRPPTAMHPAMTPHYSVAYMNRF